MADNNVIVPTVEYCDYSKDPQKFVWVCISIPGLKKKTFSSEPSNGSIDFKPHADSFTFSAKIEGGKGKTDVYEYNIKRLPADIVPEKSTCKVNKNDEVVLMLCKAAAGSWAGQLSSQGLETAVE